MKHSVLFVYTEMIVGGSTTSLLSLLNEFNYSKYNVDLLLLNKNGVLQDQIPKQVCILDNSFLSNSRRTPRYYVRFIGAYIKSKIQKNDLVRSQIMSSELAHLQVHINKKYDVALAFLEFWPSWYVFDHVTASKKIFWLHTDYSSTKLKIKHDKIMYLSADAIVTVSDSCKRNLVELLPECKERINCIPNILSQNTIRNLGGEAIKDPINHDVDLVFITVARLTFEAKGHDRAAAAFKRIKGFYPMKTFKWIIIGNGPDYEAFQRLIINMGLVGDIVLLGEKTNPHPYIKAADVFLLPSRFEGKPMSVTEAQMNGVVPLVTEYASSHDQITDGVDGLICENTDAGIQDKLDELFSGKINLDKIRAYLKSKDYSNRDDIVKLYELLG